MGVSRFYRWLSERYPLINEDVSSQQLPPCDNLYLDLNGVLHHCSHGGASEAQFKSKDDLWIAIFQYITHLVAVVKPQKLLYLAVDGVAPRAKMNQQRSRRFRAAKERLERRKALVEHGVLDVRDEFDTNCITPGTEFMADVAAHLKFYAEMKMSEDPTWAKLRVIISGPNVPGEGEHKIMDYIRRSKVQPDHDPNTRHCVYGLDADLIMLALVSHEPHFVLLRERIEFGNEMAWQRQANRISGKHERFQLLHIGLLRDYILVDFCLCHGSENTSQPAQDLHRHGPEKRGEILIEHLPSHLRQVFDLERLIDDFILLCFLVGNDFLPHLPFTEIGAGGLHRVLEVYRDYLLDEHHEGYKTGRGPWLSYDCGTIDWKTFYQFLCRWASVEDEELNNVIVDAHFLASKRKGGRVQGSTPDTLLLVQNDIKLVDEAPESSHGDPEDGKGYLSAYDPTHPPQTIDTLLEQYYKRKLFMDVSEPSGQQALQDLILNYMEGLQWNLWYYYRGVMSWSWFYKYHYPPYVQSIVQYEPLATNTLHIAFKLGRPLSPFEQLLAVLPAASSALIPQVYRPLMLDATSPLKMYYPETFSVDMEGVNVPWGGISLIPFIEEQKLLSAMRQVERQSPNGGLTEAERDRNRIGTALLLCHEPSMDRYVKSNLPRSFHDLQHCRVREQRYEHPSYPSTMTHFLNHPLEGYSKLFPGYPTLFSFPIYDASLSGGIVVFNGMTGRNPGVHLHVTSPLEQKERALEHIRSLLSSGLVAIDYPFCRVAKPVALWTSWGYFAICRSSTNDPVLRLMDPPPSDKTYDQFLEEVTKNVTHYGLHFEGSFEGSRTADSVVCDGDTPLNEVLFEVLPAEEKFEAKSGTKYRFSFSSSYRLLHLVVPHQSSLTASEALETLPEGAKVMCINECSPLFGCCGKISKSSSTETVFLLRFPFPKFEQLWQLQKELRELAEEDVQSRAWMTLKQLSTTVALPVRSVQRVIRSVLVQGGNRRKHDLGMNLVYIDRQSQRPFVVGGYAKISGPYDRHSSGYEFLYSDLAAESLKAYQQRWPTVFQALFEDTNSSNGGGTLTAAKLFPGCADPCWWLEEVIRWREQQPFAVQPLVLGYGAAAVSPKGIQSLQNCSACAISKAVVGWQVALEEREQVCVIDVEGSVPESVLAASSVMYRSTGEPCFLGALELGQRVVYAKREGQLPFGATGCVVGTALDPSSDEQVLDIITDLPHTDCTDLQGRCSPFHGCRVPSSSVMALRPLVLPWGLSSATLAEFQQAITSAVSMLRLQQPLSAERPICIVQSSPAPPPRPPSSSLKFQDVSVAFQRPKGTSKQPCANNSSQTRQQNPKTFLEQFGVQQRPPSPPPPPHVSPMTILQRPSGRGTTTTGRPLATPPVVVPSGRSTSINFTDLLKLHEQASKESSFMRSSEGAASASKQAPVFSPFGTRIAVPPPLPPVFPSPAGLFPIGPKVVSTTTEHTTLLTGRIGAAKTPAAAAATTTNPLMDPAIVQISSTPLSAVLSPTAVVARDRPNAIQGQTPSGQRGRANRGRRRARRGAR